jgi:hypothetical protein
MLSELERNYPLITEFRATSAKRYEGELRRGLNLSRTNTNNLFLNS